MTLDLSKLNPPETAPQDGRQIIAWGIDNGLKNHYPDLEIEPRWTVIQWVPAWKGGHPYWQWSVPGRSTSVTIIGWLPLPWNDEIGEYAAELLKP